MQAPVKICPQCGHAAVLSTSVCPQCGHAYAAPSGDMAYPVPSMPPQPAQGQQDNYLPGQHTPSTSNPPPRARSSFGALSTTPPVPAASSPPSVPVMPVMPIVAAMPATPTMPAAACCTHCQNILDLHSPFCRHCGADQRTLGHYVVPAAAPAPTYAPPAYGAPLYAPPAYGTPTYGSPPAPAPYPTMYSPHLPYVRPPDDFEMFDLARQYQASNKTFLWSLIIGLLLFLPLLILSYVEWKKMKEIKSRVALRGIDPEYWIRHL